MDSLGLKDLCNKLIGYWFTEDRSECILFHLTDKIFETNSKLTIAKKSQDFKPVEYNYGVGILPFLEGKGENTYYIDIWAIEKIYYIVERIDKYNLELRQFWMIPDTKPSERLIKYIRMPDTSIADNILKELGLV